MVQAARRQENLCRGKRDYRGALAVTDRLGPNRFPGLAVEHTDQIRGRDHRLTVAPDHDPFVLEIDLDPRGTIVPQSLDHGASAEKAFGGPPLHFDHLAG